MRQLIAIVVVFAFPLCALGQEHTENDEPSTSQPVSPGYIARVVASSIDGLGSPDPQIRERCTRLLTAIGEPAEDSLRFAEQTGDPETATRAQMLLGLIADGIQSLDADGIKQVLDRYRNGKPEDQLSAFQTLALRGERQLALRLRDKERDEQLRQKMLTLMSVDYEDFARLLLSMGRRDDALSLLRCACEKGAGGAARDLAFFCFDNQTLDAEIKRVADLSPHPPPWAIAFLAQAHYVRGDLPLARRLAAEIADANEAAKLIDDIAFTQHDWPMLLKEGAAKASNDKGDLNPCIPWLRYAFLNGNIAEFDRAAKSALKSSDANYSSCWGHARALILVGNFEAGISALTKESPCDAMALLFCVGRMKDAFAVAAQPRPSDSDHVKLAVWARAQLAAARETWFDGECDRGLARLQALIPTLMSLEKDKENQEIHLFWTLVSIENDLGEHAAAIAQVLEVDKEDAHQGNDQYIQMLFPDDTNEVSVIWPLIRAEHSELKESIAVLDKLRAGKLPVDQVQQIADELYRHATTKSPPQPIAAGLQPIYLYPSQQCLQVAHQLLDQIGRRSEADAVSDELIFEYRDSDEAIRRAEAAKAQEKWEDSAELYGLAAQFDPSAVNMFVYGQATSAAGHAVAAELHMRFARLMQFSNSYNRMAFARRLDEDGFHDESRSLVRLLSRTGGPEDSTPATMQLAYDLGDESKWTEAAKMFDLAVAGSFGSMYIDDTVNVQLQVDLHVFHAQAALSAGDLDRVYRELLATEWRASSDVERVIAWVKILQSHGRPADADALLDRFRTRLVDTTRLLPASALHHNALAWLDARCDAHLDEALEHARAARALWPDNTFYIDTLAEVYSHRGDKWNAIKLLQKCIQMEPEVQWHKDRLKEVAEAATATPGGLRAGQK
jgi:hypothetical protein